MKKLKRFNGYNAYDAFVKQADCTEIPMLVISGQKIEAMINFWNDVIAFSEGVMAIAGMIIDDVKAYAPEVSKVIKARAESVYRFLSFWVPELLGRFLFWMSWTILPWISDLAKKAAKASAALYGLSARVIAEERKTIVGLWQMRAELIAEYKYE